MQRSSARFTRGQGGVRLAVEGMWGAESKITSDPGVPIYGDDNEACYFSNGQKDIYTWSITSQDEGCTGTV